jgi:hypothetical protein
VAARAEPRSDVDSTADARRGSRSLSSGAAGGGNSLPSAGKTRTHHTTRSRFCANGHSRSTHCSTQAAAPRSRPRAKTPDSRHW